MQEPRRDFWNEVGRAGYHEFLKEHEGDIPSWDELKEEHKDAFIRGIQAAVKQIVKESSGKEKDNA